jgi:hypothetical protein
MTTLVEVLKQNEQENKQNYLNKVIGVEN